MDDFFKVCGEAERMKKHRIIAFGILAALCTVAAILMALSSGGAPAPNGGQTAPELRADITFSALIDNESDASWGEDLISREITRRTGVALAMISPTVDAEGTAKVILASQSYPDLVLSANNNVVSMLADAGALVPLDDFIKTRSKYIVAVFGDDLEKMRYGGDGLIYGVNREYNQQEPSISNAIFNVQYAVLAEFGYPHLKTLDDLSDLLIQYRSRYPQINGRPAIGLSFYTQSYGFNITVSNAVQQAGGYQNDGLFCIDGDGQVRYVILTEAAYRYFKWLNRLHLAGLLDPSALLQNRDALVEKASTGAVLAISTEGWDIESFNSELRKAKLNDRCYAPLPLTLSEDIESKASVYDSTGSWKSLITKNCRDSQRAFDFFDQMWSEEMQILCNWGIEGVHYSVVDGVRRINEDVYATRNSDPDWSVNTGLRLYKYWSCGSNVKDSTGQYFIPVDNREDIIRSQDEATRSVLRAYGVESFVDLCPEPRKSEWVFAWKLALPANSEGAQAELKMESIRAKMVPRIVLSQTEQEFEDNWNELLRLAGEAEIHKRELEIQQALIHLK